MDKAGDQVFAPTYGPTLPPIGFVNYCARNQNECRALGGTRYRLDLTAERWKLIGEVNAFVNTSITPATDEELYACAGALGHSRPRPEIAKIMCC